MQPSLPSNKAGWMVFPKNWTSRWRGSHVVRSVACCNCGLYWLWESGLFQQRFRSLVSWPSAQFNVRRCKKLANVPFFPCGLYSFTISSPWVSFIPIEIEPVCLEMEIKGGKAFEWLLELDIYGDRLFWEETSPILCARKLWKSWCNREWIT